MSRALEELLRSPLDDVPPKGTIRPAFVFVIAAVVGALAAAGGRAAFGDDQATPVTVSSTTTTLAATPGEAPTTIDAGEGLTIEQIDWITGDERLTVLLASRADPSIDIDVTEPLTTGDWRLRLDDQRVIPGFETSIPGTFLVAFEAPGLAPELAESIEYRPLERSVRREVVWQPGSVGFPWTPDDSEIVLDVDGTPVRVVLDLFRLDDMGGELRWHLDSESLVRVAVEVEATYREGERDERIVTGRALPTAFLQLEATAGTPRTSEVMELYHLDDPEEPTFRSRFWGDEDPVDVTDLEVRWSIEVSIYSEEAVSASVSISD